MNCLYKIKQGMIHFTQKEKQIAEYVIENKEEIVTLSAKELAKKVESSPAGIIRFSKKCGFKGFINLKLELAKNMEKDKTWDINDMISDTDSIEIMVKKSIASDIATLEKTKNLMNYNDIEEAINWIKKANKIYLYGVGASGLIAADFQYKLLRIGKNVEYNFDSHIQLSTAAMIDKNDIAIAISYSGDKKEVNLAIKEAKEKGAKIIAITRYNGNSTLSKISDICLNIPNEEKEFRLGAIASRVSALSIIDVLYLGIVRDNIDDTKKCIIETRDIVTKLI